MQALSRELHFLLYEVLAVGDLVSREHFSEHSRAGFDSILATARRIAEDSFADHYVKADHNEPHFDGETVTLIPETKTAWDAFAQAGFLAASFDEAWGGIQLPEVIARAAMSYFNVANVATAGYPFLTIGVANLVAAFANPELKAGFLPALLEGRFSGTMALSEPAQGSSLADITTTAYAQPDGSYRLKGQKIYISAGDHELTENIIHMVLAKIEGAPAGVKGISLFLCPKYLLTNEGEIGPRNDVHLAGLLHKMGYRNTTSTVLSFGDQGTCQAYLVGEAHQGLFYMFQMMNEARIGVGLGAASLGWAGYQYSLGYARERKQGRLASAKNPRSPQVAIIDHADIRRMLLAQKVYVEGSLALCLYASRLVDDIKTGSAAEREQATMLLDFLTPIVKSYPSRYALKANDLAIQVLAGAGYLRDHPVEQYYRDNRLNPIHEGTEGIQALDLLARKVPLQQAVRYQAWSAVVLQTIAEAAVDPLLEPLSQSLAEHLKIHQETTHCLLAAMKENVDLALANASVYLDMTGRLVIAWQWLIQAIRASEAIALQASVSQASASQGNFYLGKVQAAKFMFSWELPHIKVQAELLKAIDDTPFAMQADWF